MPSNTFEAKRALKLNKPVYAVHQNIFIGSICRTRITKIGVKHLYNIAGHKCDIKLKDVITWEY